MAILRKYVQTISERNTYVRYSLFFNLLSVPLFVMLHNINEFRDLIFTADVLVLSVFWFLLPLLFYFSAKALTKLSKDQIVLLTVYFSMAFFLFGPAQDFLSRNINNLFFSRSYFLLIFLFTVPFIFYKSFDKTKNAIRLKYISKTLFVLIFYECLVFLLIIINSTSYSSISQKFTKELSNNSGSGNIKSKPDIYHIVFDAYTNSDMLRKYWNYSNGIDSFLVQKGFFNVTNSSSNYNFTPFSLACTFNLQYLSNVREYLPHNTKNFYIGRLAYRDNELFKILRSQNYEIRRFSLLDTVEYMDEMGIPRPHNPVSWLRYQTMERIHLNPWVKHKVLRLLNNNRLPNDLLKNYKAFIEYNQKASSYVISSMMDSTRNVKPRFHFIHFMLPHGPYLFDENGSVNMNKHSEPKVTSYLDQVKYSNKIIQEIIELLMADPKEKVIIIQGDHGYRSYPNGTAHQEQFKILNAIFLYDRNYKSLSKDISLVNTYRIVLNNYFNYDLPLIKDSLFLSSGSYPIDFSNATN